MEYVDICESEFERARLPDESTHLPMIARSSAYFGRVAEEQRRESKSEPAFQVPLKMPYYCLSDGTLPQHQQSNLPAWEFCGQLSMTKVSALSI